MTVLRRLAWLWILIVGIGLFEGVRRAIIDTGNPNLVPTLILLGAAVIPAAFVSFVYQRRLPYDISGGMVIAFGFLGGVIGVVAASLTEYHTLRRLGTLPMVGVGLAEEAAKLLVPAAVLLFSRYTRRPDGLLIGVATGAGFAVLETMGYAFVALVQSQGSLAAVDGVLVLRGLFSPAAHMAWTGLTAAALWEAAERGWRASSVLNFAAIFAVAVVLHTAWDSVHQTSTYVVLAAISLLLLAVSAHRMHHRALAEGRVPRRHAVGQLAVR